MVEPVKRCECGYAFPRVDVRTRVVGEFDPDSLTIELGADLTCPECEAEYEIEFPNAEVKSVMQDGQPVLRVIEGGKGP